MGSTGRITGLSEGEHVIKLRVINNVENIVEESLKLKMSNNLSSI